MGVVKYSISEFDGHSVTIVDSETGDELCVVKCAATDGADRWKAAQILMAINMLADDEGSVDVMRICSSIIALAQGQLAFIEWLNQQLNKEFGADVDQKLMFPASHVHETRLQLLYDIKDKFIETLAGCVGVDGEEHEDGS